MRFVSPSFVAALCLLLCCFAGVGADGAVGPEAGNTEVRRDFETILDLWRDGRFADLYDRTYAAGSRSRESFLRKMSVADRRPACCWEKMQEVKVTVSGADSATLHARIGLERTGTETDSCTRSFRMKRESGVWKASLSDILSLAGTSRKKSSRR
jgi:hypothetical protein